MTLRWLRSRRLDLLESAFLVAFAAVAAGAAANRWHVSPEWRALAAAYGPDRFSQHIEEWVIRDFFKDRRGGFFVDVGASHYRTFSNTYYLEARLGWSGVAVEPQRAYEADYVRFRPRTRFFAFFAGEESGQNARLWVLDHTPYVASSERAFTEGWGEDAREVAVPTITLSDLLGGLKVTSVDLLSIDVELAEPRVLAGFDIDRYRPAFVCIEAHAQVRQRILDYFTRHRYVVAGQYLRADTDNLYFVPLT